VSGARRWKWVFEGCLVEECRSVCTLEISWNRRRTDRFTQRLRDRSGECGESKKLCSKVNGAYEQLHRHTARYPTTDGGKRLLKSLGKLRDRSVHLPRRHPELAFLGAADYDLKGWQFDGLMDQGRKA
jgi:hypothetical protein